jgi:hypothetical protein
MEPIVAHLWQEINVRWLSCHSWQDVDQSSITAMTFILILLAVAAVLAVDTVRLVLTDGQGPQRPPVSHFQDPDFISPPAR